MASFNFDENKENFVYIFKSNMLYGYIDKFDLFVYDDKGIPNLKNEDWDKFLDLLPKGIDLKIMKY